MPIQTDMEIKANRPDIIIKDKKFRKCLLIDTAVPSERNDSMKIIEKLSKYKDLEIKINRMWRMKTEAVPIVIGALGLVRKGMDNFTNSVPGNINIQVAQKIALLKTSHILRQVLSVK